MSVKVQLSPEEIAREEALFNLRNNLQATHDANVSAVKAEVSEKDRKDQEEKAKRERIITKEGEALKLSKQGRLLSFVYVVLICAIVGFAYMEYKLALNGKFSWAALTATGNIQRIVKIVFTESGWIAFAYATWAVLVIPLFFYIILPLFGKIAKDVIAKDVSEPFFLLRVLSAFSSAYSIIEERNTEKVREMMSLEDDKHRKCDFTKMGQGYFFYDFLSALYKGYKDSGVVKPRRKSAGDENSELIDAMLRNLRLYVTDRANASQGRNDDGTFANNEAMVVYPELRGIPEENRKYVYSFPVAYPVKNLLDSLPMFQQEFRKKSLGIKIEYPSDCSAIYFTVFPVIDLFEKGLVFNWHEAMEKSVTLKRSPLEIPVGVDETGNIVLLPSIADNPHAMLAGGTGTGKSVAEWTIILGYVHQNSPEEFAVVLADPHLSPTSAALKDSIFNYFRGRVFQNKQELLSVVRALVHEMEYRIGVFWSMESITTIAQYNSVASSLSKPKFRRIVAFFEEWSAFFEQLNRDERSEIESLMSRIAKEGRKFGVHLLIVEQNPLASALSTGIKNQMPIRLCMRMENRTMSDIVLGWPESGMTADEIPTSAKGFALVKGRWAMKFLVIPETDPEIQSERRFRNLKEFVANVEARHQVGTAIPEEYIESITHIPEEDMEPLGLADSESELADAEQSTNGKDALSVASIDQLFSEIKNYSQTAEVMLTNAEVAVLAFAYVNGSVAQKSWTSELGDALDVGRNEFQKQVTAFLGIALKKTEDGPYKKTVLMNPDIRVVVDSLIQYRKNESQAPKIPTP